MNKLIKAIAVTVAFVIPAVSFAQTSQSLTRDQVREQLVQVEKAGYIPGSTDAYAYPQNIRSAESAVAAQNNGPNTDGHGR
ncbi:DUF4148 domain-containing protein [Burkholderia sp. Bp8963]|uniref:DUF4148 domain-containing protein n=1 Tax=Burkholderia sp. Bp8963 TaxID=2184547 RepID=UPI00163A929B|nr:DUF4148 domain-containing protein [Burkholderia sp. Bp8963]